MSYLPRYSVITVNFAVFTELTPYGDASDYTYAAYDTLFVEGPTEFQKKHLTVHQNHWKTVRQFGNFTTSYEFCVLHSFGTPQKHEKFRVCCQQRKR
ncbi:hypothetical protein Y032_0047g1472 [Ancylostoma ceylanicum]|uniref:Uncharacterized protein n=1 Tax=Ancylostoma ceylanicum TaxID=53326 RepID=A0A016UBV8_9BILA|nr:hypothetical protein Y032_0047g1472 [Ancylostoma ceylanicum]